MAGKMEIIDNFTNFPSPEFARSNSRKVARWLSIVNLAKLKIFPKDEQNLKKCIGQTFSFAKHLFALFLRGTQRKKPKWLMATNY